MHACSKRCFVIRNREFYRGHPKWSCSYQWARSMQQSAVRAAVIISVTTLHRYQAHCTHNWPIRGLGYIPVTNERTARSSPWSWLITLRKLIISKVKFLSPPLFVLGAMNTNFINLLNISNFTSHQPPPISASENLSSRKGQIGVWYEIKNRDIQYQLAGLPNLCRKYRTFAIL